MILPIIHIINYSMINSIILDELKIMRVVRIHKKRNRSCLFILIEYDLK